ADVEKSDDGAAGAFRELLGGTAKPIGEHSDRGGAGEKNPARRCVEDVAQSKGERDKQQQRVGHDRNLYAPSKPEAICWLRLERQSERRCHSGNDPLQSDLPPSSPFFKLPFSAPEQPFRARTRSSRRGSRRDSRS